MDPSIRQQLAWSPGQRILNDTGAREPEHIFHQPVPITARIVCADAGEEHIETEAAGWTGRLVYVRVPIPAIGSRQCGSTPRTFGVGERDTDVAHPRPESTTATRRRPLGKSWRRV